MAVSLTTRLGLKRWSTSTDEWIGREGFNAQNDLLDDMVAIDDQGPISARPVAGVRGFYYYATDTEQLYRDTGSGWVPIGVDATKLAGEVPAASLPTIPLNLLPTLVPIGGGIQWWGGAIPTNFLRPQGQELSRTTYAVLFALWGTMHGAGNGTTTFNMPNGKGRTFVGADPAQTEFTPVGKTGGAKAVTLTTAQMPPHDHGGETGDAGIEANVGKDLASTNPAGSAGIARADGNSTGLRGVQSSTHDHAISEEGGGQSHNNLQPYFVGEHLIRVL